MSRLDDLKARASKANPQARTAFLSACAERVLPIYEDYWVGDYYPSVARSVEIGWTYALGADVNAEELRTCLDEVQDLVTYYHEEPTRHEILAAAVTVVLRMLQSITPDEEASIIATARGISSTIDTAKSAEWMANWDTPEPARTKVAADEERKWQEAAIARIENWTGPVTRTMFDDLGAKPPAWLTDWKARTVRYR
jgi:hypothetical protein